MNRHFDDHFDALGDDTEDTVESWLRDISTPDTSVHPSLENARSGILDQCLTSIPTVDSITALASLDALDSRDEPPQTLSQATLNDNHDAKEFANLDVWLEEVAQIAHSQIDCSTADEVEALTASLPLQYSQTMTIQQKLIHVRMLRELRAGTAVGALTAWVRRAAEVRGRYVFQLHIAFKDRSGSLGALTSALSQQSCDILEASVYVTSDGYGLDTFVLSVLTEDISRIDACIHQVLGLSRGAPAPEAAAPPRTAAPDPATGHKQPESSSSSSSSAVDTELAKQVMESGGKKGVFSIEWDQPQFSSLVMHHLLGEGGGSKVYKAWWRGTFVAVKVLKVDPSMRCGSLKSFVQEARILSQVRHPSICTCIGTCMQQGFPAIVLEYLSGGSLHNLLHNRADDAEPLSARLLSRITLEVATGVAYLHDNGIIHRDVKAANVLLDARHHAKVTDFGISTKFGGEHTAETGTYRSMAPEVISHKEYDYKCDVYSFGMLVWEIVHQRIPFEDDNGLQAAYAVTTEGKRPEMCPRADLTLFCELIQQCWQQLPANRPNMEAVVQELIKLDSIIGKHSSSSLSIATGRSPTVSTPGMGVRCGAGPDE